MRAATAYFAGAGTVIAAIVGGVGGGLLIADMISPKIPKQETTHLEQRMSAKPIPVVTAPSEPVPYLAAPQQSAAVVAPPAQPQNEPAHSVPSNAPVDTAAAAPEPSPSQPPTPPAKPAAQEPAAVPRTAPEEALARVRDADIKRTVEKRKVDRRQQWAEKRRQRQQQELQAVEYLVREETEPRRELAAEPIRVEMPQIKLFGLD